MATKTTNLNLTKPGLDDSIEVSELNENFNIIDAAVAGKVDKVEGKGLSTNDFTNEAKTKLDGLKNYDDTNVKAEVAKTAEQSALNRSTLGYQAKNLLENTGVSKTLNGLTFTVNADKSVTLNGTLQSGKTSSFYVSENLVLPKTVLKKTKGFLIGSFSKSSGAWVATVVGTNTETFDASGFDYNNYIYKANIQRNNGAVYDDAVVYPMIYLPDITDTTYEPYKPSVEERFNNVNNMIFGLGTAIPSGADLNDYTQAGVYFCFSIEDSQSVLNNPYKARGFRLEVVCTVMETNRFIQKIFPNDKSEGAFYMRAHDVAGFGSWYKFQGEEVTT